LGTYCVLDHSSLLVLDLEATANETSAAGSNKTSLLTDGAITTAGRGVTNMLLVTTTVGMVDGVHSNTTDAGVVVLLGVTLPPGGTSLEERLVGTLATGDDTDHSTAGALNGLADTGGETDTGLGEIFGVTDDDSGGAGGTGEGSAVTVLGLNI